VEGAVRIVVEPYLLYRLQIVVRIEEQQLDGGGVLGEDGKVDPFRIWDGTQRVRATSAYIKSSLWRWRRLGLNRGACSARRRGDAHGCASSRVLGLVAGAT
jgi:hypothetical protein